VACSDDIFIVDVSTQVKQPLSNTPQDAYYHSHALSLSFDDAVLVVGNARSPCNVCGYDTASLERLWIYDTADEVGAVCMLGVHVLASVALNPTLVLEVKTGTHIGALQKAQGLIFGLGVIEGLCFFLFLSLKYLRAPHLRVPHHAPASPLQTTPAHASASGDVGLDREVSRVVVIGCCDGQPITPFRQSQTQSRWIQDTFGVCNHLCEL
jgi:hypothetical protein